MATKSKIIALIIGLLVILTACTDKLGDRYVSFAQCLRDKGVKMYGAYWCPHCSNQRREFGKEAFKKVFYIECDPRGQDGNPNLCRAKNIKGYPTWDFADGSRVEGEMKLSQLAKKSNCQLPPES